jgi:membrane protease YdiL (CAAX protease family)
VSSFRNSIRNSNAGAYLLYFLSFVFFVFVSAVVLQVVGFHLTTIISEVVAILGAAFIWRWVTKDAAAGWPSLRPKASVGAYVALALAAIGLGFLANTIAALLVELSPWMAESAEAYSERIAELLLEASGVERVLGIIGVCVAAPICEEALFRGTILQEERKVEGVGVAVVVNGILFSAFHVNPVSALGLAILGAFFAHITIRSGSLIPAIVAHAVVNTTNAVVLPEIMPEAADPNAPIEIPQLLMLMGGLAALSSFFWWLSVHLMRKRTGD